MRDKLGEEEGFGTRLANYVSVVEINIPRDQQRFSRYEFSRPVKYLSL